MSSTLLPVSYRTNSSERIVLQAFFDKWISDINVVETVNTLQRHGVLGVEFAATLLAMDDEGKEKRVILDALCDELLDKCPIDRLVHILYTDGQKQLARTLFLMYHELNHTNSVSRMTRVEVGNRSKITLYFKQVKKLVHDIGFEHPYLDVRKLGTHLKLRIERENDPAKRMYLCDKYVAHKAAEMDALSNISDCVSVDHAGFQELESFVQSSSVPSLSRLILLGRKADQLSTVRRFEEGEGLLRECYICADGLTPCAEITDMIYKGVVFRLSQFEETPTRHVQDMIFMEAHKGLWMLSFESEDVQLFWRRLFILRMVFALLGVGKQCRIVKNYKPDGKSITQAKDMLEKPELADMEIRREMFKFVALARMNEVMNRTDTATGFIKKAKQIAIEGCYTELKGIEEYETELELQKKST